MGLSTALTGRLLKQKRGRKLKGWEDQMRGSLLLSGILLTAAVSVAQAQSEGIKRTPLQKFDVPGTKYETIIGIAEIAPNVSIGRHTHPGVESGYMADGEATLLVEGQSDKPLKAGDSYQIPAGAIHDARSGGGGAKVIATYVVEKGKPLASPAP